MSQKREAEGETRMKTEKFYIGNIPVIVWGEWSEKVYLYVHGKMARKEEAAEFAEIAKSNGWQTVSFDLPAHGERKDEAYPCNIWNGISDLRQLEGYVFSSWSRVSLYACSIGAYFCLHAYGGRTFENCLFLSPIVDMEYLIQNMFSWFHVTEDMLRNRGDISTPIETLSWDYYQYVKRNPIVRWNSSTHILYGGRDNLQSLEVIKTFADLSHSKLTVSPNSEHAFMEAADNTIVKKWIAECIQQEVNEI